MAKMLQDNIKDVRIENDDGDLIPVLDEAGQQFSDLINAVVSHNKAGTLTLKISVKPSTAGALAVKAEVKTSKPKGLPPESLLWATPDGNLIAEDPRQTRLELRPVADDPKRELKNVAA
jgi:hypothetical protein